jgi:hypothetical protein
MVVNGSVSSDGVDRAEVSAEDDVDDADRTAKTRPASPPKGGRRRIPLIAVGVVIVAAVAVIAVLVSSGGSGGSNKATSTTTVPVKAGFTAFSDAAAGFSLTYPASWTPVTSNDPNVPLLATIGTDNLNTFLVRVVPIPSTVDTSNVDNIKAVTDAVLSGTRITVLKQQSLTVNGLPAYYYFYTLPTEVGSGTTLVHSHFFLFPPHQMVSLLFQTQDKDFPGLAATFDKVVGSLRAIPAAGGTATSTP